MGVLECADERSESPLWTAVTKSAESPLLASGNAGASDLAVSIQFGWGAHAPSRAVDGALADHNGAIEPATIW